MAKRKKKHKKKIYKKKHKKKIYNKKYIIKDYDKLVEFAYFKFEILLNEEVGFDNYIDTRNNIAYELHNFSDIPLSEAKRLVNAAIKAKIISLYSIKKSNPINQMLKTRYGYLIALAVAGGYYFWYKSYQKKKALANVHEETQAEEDERTAEAMLNV